MEDDIQVAQVETLFQETGLTVLTHLLTAILVVALLWNQVSPAQSAALAVWFVAVLVASAVRAETWRQFCEATDKHVTWRNWAQIGIGMSCLFGVLWALAILLLFDMEHPVSSILLTVIPTGLSGAAAAKNASVPTAFYVLDVPITLALAVVILSLGTPFGYGLGGLITLAAFGRVVIVRRLHTALERSLRLGFENLALREEAERANAAKSRFLASASHDLRQPIHAMGLSFSALSARVSSPNNAGLIAQVEGCMGAVRDMLGTLLGISKLDAGVVRAEMTDLDLSALLMRLEQELIPVAESSRNHLHMPLQPLPQVRTDATMLESILRNLLGNALRYTRDGEVRVRVVDRDGLVRIEVRDTGIGIPEDQQQEVFQEFRQLGNPERDRNRGLGADLMVVDYRLPGECTGADVIARVTAARDSAIPAMIITSDTAPNRLREAQALGLPLLHKPVKPARLRAALGALAAQLMDEAEPG